MDWTAAVTKRLGVGSATAGKVGDHVHWNTRPQNEPLPALVLTVVSGDRPQHLKGFEDMRTARLQASGFATSYGVARSIVEAAIADLVPAATVADPAGADVLFWRGDAEEPRDLGSQSDTDGFVYQAQADLTIRWGLGA